MKRKVTICLSYEIFLVYNFLLRPKSILNTITFTDKVRLRVRYGYVHCESALKPNKVQLIQELKPADHQQRSVFADWVVEMHENDLEFHPKIILSDEAHFHLGGFVNKQNFRIWGSENPRVIVEMPLYPHRVTEAKAGATVTVNGLRYREMINDFLGPK